MIELQMFLDTKFCFCRSNKNPVLRGCRQVLCSLSQLVKKLPSGKQGVHVVFEEKVRSSSCLDLARFLLTPGCQPVASFVAVNEGVSLPLGPSSCGRVTDMSLQAWRQNVKCRWNQFALWVISPQSFVERNVVSPSWEKRFETRTLQQKRHLLLTGTQTAFIEIHVQQNLKMMAQSDLYDNTSVSILRLLLLSLHCHPPLLASVFAELRFGVIFNSCMFYFTDLWLPYKRTQRIVQKKPRKWN